MTAAQTRNGLTNDPRLLAGVAGGLVSALAALLAFRGLPFGLGLFWLSPLPLFMAGLGFGKLAGGIAVGTGTVALLLAQPGWLTALLWLGLYGVPVLLLLFLGLQEQPPRISTGLPLAALGVWPAALTLLAAFLAADAGGLEAVLRAAVAMGLERMGTDAPEAVVTQIVRLQAAALALWLAIALVANSAAAQAFLQRRRLALAPAPAWRQSHLPRWYPALPGLAGLVWLMSGSESLLPLSLCLVLSVPLLLQGLAAMHRRLASFSGRLPLLILFYVLILVFSLPGALVLVALGLLEQYGRRNPPANM
ncbi:DUF2232 domain-containing protein [Teichococcus oryzae]|uniref:DUF2232 domain-containing protein n=1 Tax=Teichococcus oryzae TaxID=1608942 RepID=A0A5B2TJH2_9PROT|nr:DUF2232 domain-containing protein [Pseudoroseomonas oryzae]KAA2214329.1 DUF2232 domain-containing protein [Pseudoroseomonas oryzae]